ncbi:MAG: SDR family oxidoreductase [Deltaproteobacteria bacterium]|nr:MAG: SDR family oxidoreductase [Deltaproteobacteria bacterium]
MTQSHVFRSDLLTDQVCLVTGGGTGIGAGIARELGRAGAHVAIASRKAEHILPAAEGLSKELGREVLGVVCDIRDRDAVAAAYTKLMAWKGRLDVLVNNGGGQFFSPAEAISPRGWDAVVQTNLTGTWNMTHGAFHATMGKHGGVILNITMLTKRTFPGMTHSVAARAGVEAMTRNLAVEWAARGIRINCIAPGLILSSGVTNYPNGEQLFRDMQKHIPLKRAGAVQDIAHMATFLASEGGRYITGQTLTIDGGKELWGDWWPIADPAGGLPEVSVPREPWED